jgi:hypothetical protein
MRRQGSGKAIEFLWPSGKWTDSASHDHALSRKFLSVRHPDLEASTVDFDAADLSPFHIRNGLALIPTAIVDKSLQWNRLRNGIARLPAVGIQRQFLLGIGNMGGSPIGS